MDKIKPRDYIYIDYNLYFGYDENDDELCISFIDKLNYRRTLSICIEMYMRRQLKEYHDFCDAKGYHIRWRNRFQNLQLTLPQLYINSNNPDGIKKLDVRIDENSKMEPKSAKDNATETTFNFDWWTCDDDDGDEPSSEFRCRPALFNSMDCVQLLFESSEHVSKDIIAKVFYHLRPFRFVLPLTFLFDIFGGVHTTDIIEKNFPTKKCRAFPDNLL